MRIRIHSASRSRTRVRRDVRRARRSDCHSPSTTHSLHGPDEVLTQAGKPYRVYTPYSRNWLELEKTRAARQAAGLDDTRRTLNSLPLPTVAHWGWETPQAEILEPGERAAPRTPEAGAFPESSRDYAANTGLSRRRGNIADFAGPALRTDFHPHGVSRRSMKARATANPAGRAGIDTFIKELAWREFYFAILHHFPNVLDEEFNADWRGLPWDEPGPLFEAWKEGRTGFPIVDAGHARIARHRIHAQPRADDHRDVSHQGSAHRLETGRVPLHAAPRRWRNRLEQRRLAMVGRHGRGRRPVFPDPKSVVPNRPLRSRRHLHQTLGAGAGRRPSIAFSGATAKTANPIAPGYPLPCVDHKTERERTLAIFKRHRESNPRA